MGSTPSQCQSTQQDQIPSESNGTNSICTSIDKETVKKMSRDEITKMMDTSGVITKQNDGFFAHSYEEDCWLCGGGRQVFTERVEWEKGNDYIVAYYQENQMIMLFGKKFA